LGGGQEGGEVDGDVREVVVEVEPGYLRREEFEGGDGDGGRCGGWRRDCGGRRGGGGAGDGLGTRWAVYALGGEAVAYAVAAADGSWGGAGEVTYEE
jgi:hypothetical protein